LILFSLISPLADAMPSVIAASAVFAMRHAVLKFALLLLLSDISIIGCHYADISLPLPLPIFFAIIFH